MHRRPALCAIALVAALPATASCASLPRSCGGLEAEQSDRLQQAAAMERADARTPTAHLQCLSDSGIASAQVELAHRYELGEGVEQDPVRAMALYERVARGGSSNLAAVYSPPVTTSGSGQVLFLEKTERSTASAEAQYRLGRMLIAGMGRPEDVARGWRLIARAAARGHTGAIEWWSKSMPSPRGGT